MNSCVHLYGPEFVTHAIHLILHLPEDCLRFGKPEKFSCFPFEDYNYELTNRIVSGQKPVQQMRNRYEENIYSGLREKLPHWKNKLNNVVLLQLHKLQKGNFIFSSKNEGDRYCSVKGTGSSRWPTLVKIHSFRQEENEIIASGQKFEFVTLYFTSPCSSEEIGIYECAELSSSFISFKAENIRKKFYAISNDSEKSEKMVLIELLHI